MNTYLSKLITFDLKTGLAGKKDAESLKRPLSRLKDIFSDRSATTALLEKGDPLVYEFYDMGIPEKAGGRFRHLHRLSGNGRPRVLHDEGHFHTILDTAEVYLCLRGHGMMMMESPEGKVEYRELRPGQAVYVPGRYAHRSINLSKDEQLVTFLPSPPMRGHDWYDRSAGVPCKLVLATDDGYEVVDNPNWKGSGR